MKHLEALVWAVTLVVVWLSGFCMAHGAMRAEIEQARYDAASWKSAQEADKALRDVLERSEDTLRKNLMAERAWYDACVRDYISLRVAKPVDIHGKASP